MTPLCINPDCSEPENPDDRTRCQACGARLVLGQRFRPVKLLGQGGFGRTVLAWDEATEPPERCVVKQIVRSGSRDRDLAEAQRLAELGQHPQIPQLIAILDSPRDLCLVQSYIPGRNLAQTLQADGVFDESRVRSLLLDLLPVLRFIHQRGIIHRDVKPENILLPDQGLPVLVDFGAARPVPTATALEHTGTVIGSAGYAAPEQALGKAVPASDLYSLGMTCLHLLTDTHPFDLYSVAADRWVWQDLAPEPVSPALSRVLNRLVARALRSRYSNADDVLADLAPAGIWSPRPSTSVRQKTAESWHCTQVWQTSGRTVNAIAVSPDGRAIATGNSDHAVQIWDAQAGKVLHTFARRFGFGEGHGEAVTAVAFHPAGDRLFTAGHDGQIKQWDLSTYRLRQSLQQASWQITAMALTPDGQRLAVADAEGRITLWDVTSGRRQYDLMRHAGSVNDLVVSPDGSRLASVGEAGTLRLWALPTGQLLHTWTAPRPLRCVALSTTAPALTTGDRSGQFVAWSLTDFTETSELTKAQDAASAIALSPNEQWLALGSRDRTIQLWHWLGRDRRCSAELQHDWGITDLAFADHGNTLISSGSDETIRFWQLLF